MNATELAEYVKASHNLKTSTELVEMLESGNLDKAAAWALGRGMGGLWMKIREAAALPCSSDDWTAECAKVIAARKARFARR